MKEKLFRQLQQRNQSHLRRNNRQKVELIRVTIQEIRVETAKAEQLEAEKIRVDRLQEVQKNQSQSQIQNRVHMKLPLSICFIKTMEKQKQTKQMKKRQ